MWYLIDNDRRITNEVGELQYSLAETMHSLAEDLAAELGKRVRLATPVTRIEHGPDGVRVVTEREAIAADAALVAVPPVMASRIAYAPALPPQAGACARRVAERHGDQGARPLHQGLLARPGPERHGDVARAIRPLRLRPQPRRGASGARLLHRRAAGDRVGPAGRGGAAGGGEGATDGSAGTARPATSGT